MSRVLVDSGVSWLGKIPDSWSTCRVKNKFLFHKIIAKEKSVNYDRIALTLNGVIKRDKDDSNGLQPDNYNGYQVVYKDDLIFKLIDLENVNTSRIGKSEYEGITSPAYLVLTDKCNTRYSLYYFLNMWYQEIFNNIGGDGVRSAINKDDLLKVPFINISIDEQNKIANYLDKQSAKIDEIIRDNNKEIELLNEYKLSEIEKSIFKGLNENEQYIECRKKWVGKMNSKYELIPIKYLKSKKKNAFVDGPFGSNLKSEHFIDNGDVYVIESGFISTGKFIFKDFKTISNEHFETIKRSECNEKDIIIAKIGASYGMCAELPYLDKKSVVSGNSLKITLDNNKILNEIFIKEMQIAKNKGGFLELVNETAQPALSLSGLNNFKLVVPPMEEQVIIVKEINRIETKIDEVIKYRRNIINSLEEYKRSLIYECVTGKREV